jgi:hypothetical protein
MSNSSHEHIWYVYGAKYHRLLQGTAPHACLSTFGGGALMYKDQ